MRALLTLTLVLTACGDDDGRDPADSGPGTDTGPGPMVDAGPRDAGPPPVDAGPPPGDTLATNVCTSAGAVAVSPDGTQVAYVTCAAPAGAVRVVPIAGGTPIDLAMVTGAGPEIVWSPDSMHLAFGAEGAWGLNTVAGDGPATLATSGVEELRFIQAGTEIRLLVLENTPAGRRVVSRSSTDAYAAAVEVVAADPTYMGGLQLVSGSGNNFFFTAGADNRWQQSPTNVAGAVGGLPFTRDNGTMAVGGLGDTHGIVRTATGGLTWVELMRGLESPTAFEVAPSGVLEDPDALLIANESPTVRWFYFVRDGDPTRWQRGGTTAAAETLAAADATGLAITPNAMRLVYPSGGTLESLPVTGGAATTIIADLGEVSDFVVAVSPDSSELITLDGTGAVRRAAAATEDEAATLDDGADPSSLGYDGAGARAWWIDDAELRSIETGALAATVVTVAGSVASWWPIPASAQVVYQTADGTLRVLTL